MKLSAHARLVAVGGVLCAVTGFVACTGNDGARGAPGSTAIVQSTDEPPGDHCPAGGVMIVTGLDTNGDGELAKDEISGTKYVCNGVAGDAGSQGGAGPEGPAGPSGDKGDPGDKGDKGDPGDAGPPGATGDAGPKGDPGATGPKGDPGDAGPAGATGPTGPTGAAGPKGDKGDLGSNGDPGDAGAAGLNALVSVDPESAAGGHCPYGGIRARAGLDANRSGVLDDNEVTSTEYVCNGAPGSAGGAGASGSAGTSASSTGGGTTAGSGGTGGSDAAGAPG